MNTTVHPVSLKEKQRKEREDLILQVAEEVLMEKGYHAMLMDEIATRVGVAKGTLYLHFARKDDLVSRLLENDIERVLRVIDSTSTMEGNAKAKLLFIFDSLYRGFLEQRGQLLFTLYNSIEASDMLREKQHIMTQQVTERVTALLDEGKASHLFRAAIPTEVMMSMFFSMLSPRSCRYLITEKHLAPQDLATYVEDIYFQGIAEPDTLCQD